MRTVVQLRSRLDAAALQQFAGGPVLESDASLLLQGDADCYKPDGEALVLVRRGLIDPALLEAAYPALYGLRVNKTTNRGKYSGEQRVEKVFADGVKSKNTHTTAVASSIIGYFDRQGGRFPFCLATAFTASEVEKWGTVQPLAVRVAEIFQDVLPKRYAKQAAIAATAPAEFVIAGTPFTTITVNNNVAPSGVHQDKGDYKDGFGAILVLRRGEYKGAHLVFPEYGVSADLHDGDLLFFNSHEWHGVTPFREQHEGAVRISLVFYFREKMVRCGSSADELENAKRVRGRL